MAAVLMPVRMAVEAGGSLTGYCRLAVIRRVELLLREWREQQAQAFQLARRQDAIEHFEVIGQRDKLALRDIPEVGTLDQIHGWRKRGQEALGQIKIDVKTSEIATILALYRVNLLLREHEAAGGVLRMRQR